MKRIFLVLLPLLMNCCSNTADLLRYDAVSKNYAYKANKVNVNYAMPREGWATDPHLSYNLYSYYPVNQYNNGIVGHFGYQGLYYH